MVSNSLLFSYITIKCHLFCVKHNSCQLPFSSYHLTLFQPKRVGEALYLKRSPSKTVIITLSFLFITKLTSFIIEDLQCTVSGGVDEQQSSWLLWYSSSLNLPWSSSLVTCFKKRLRNKSLCLQRSDKYLIVDFAHCNTGLSYVYI